MKLLIDVRYVKSDYPTGVSIYAERLLNGLLTKVEYSIFLLVSRENRCYFSNKYPITKCIEYTKSSHCMGADISSIIRKYGIDILFSPFLTINSVYASNCKSIGTLHDFQPLLLEKKLIKRFIYRFLLCRIIKKYSHIVVISFYTLDRLTEFLPNFVRHASVIYNSLDYHSIAKMSQINSDPYILTVNSMEPYKNIITLVKAYAIIHEKTACKLVIKSQRNEYWDKVISPLINKCNLIEKVVLIDKKMNSDEMCNLYSNASLFVTTSLAEGFGFTPIEAAMMCVPVIATKEGALYETTCGLLNYYEQAEDEIELANMMMKVLYNKTSYETLYEISQKYKRKYSVSKQLDKFCKLFEDLIYGSRN